MSTMTNTPSPLEPVTADQLTRVTGGAGADVSSWVGIANKIFGMVGSSKGGGNPLGSLLGGGGGKGGGLLGNLFGGGNKSGGDTSNGNADGGDASAMSSDSSSGE
jgi:hypothetical protein